MQIYKCQYLDRRLFKGKKIWFAILMGTSRAFYGKYGDRIKLDTFMKGSCLLCIASYLGISLLPVPAKATNLMRSGRMKVTAANCIWVNDTVIVPEGYPAVLKAVQDLGYKTILVDTSEYRKLDGGLSCLSLRF